MSEELSDYTLTGADLTRFSLQPAFVEGIIADHKRFTTLAEAYWHIFRRNLEYGILLWNGLPVRFSYTEDLPQMVSPLIAMLHDLHGSQMLNRGVYEFRTTNLHTQWQVEANAENVTIAGIWHHVPGHYEGALNQMGMILMSRLAFLCEWKLLLEQLSKAMSDAEAILTQPDARTQLQTLRDIEASIPARGSYYQY